MTLTEREREVLVDAARGRTAISTAHDLGITHNTVKTYRSRICQKLSARNMTQAVAIAYEKGEIQ